MLQLDSLKYENFFKFLSPGSVTITCVTCGCAQLQFLAQQLTILTEIFIGFLSSQTDAEIIS
jgi:hypothetical protein